MKRSLTEVGIQITRKMRIRMEKMMSGLDLARKKDYCSYRQMLII